MVLDYGLLQTAPDSTDAYLEGAGGSAGNIEFVSTNLQNTWAIILTVPVGKTYYLTNVLISTGGLGPIFYIGTGAAGSEVTSMQIQLRPDTVYDWDFTTPVKFSSGTIISIKKSEAIRIETTFIGREE